MRNRSQNIRKRGREQNRYLPDTSPQHLRHTHAHIPSYFPRLWFSSEADVNVHDSLSVSKMFYNQTKTELASFCKMALIY